MNRGDYCRQLVYSSDRRLVYIREFHPTICSAVFMFECSKGQSKLVGSLPEHTLSANAYIGGVAWTHGDSSCFAECQQDKPNTARVGSFLL